MREKSAATQAVFTRPVTRKPYLTFIKVTEHNIFNNRESWDATFWKVFAVPHSAQESCEPKLIPFVYKWLVSQSR